MQHQTQNGVGIGSQWENPDPLPRGGASYLLDILSKRSASMGTTSRGVPGVGGDADGATRTLHVPSRAGHNDNCGGGKPNPPTVYPL